MHLISSFIDHLVCELILIIFKMKTWQRKYLIEFSLRKDLLFKFVAEKDELYYDRNRNCHWIVIITDRNGNFVATERGERERVKRYKSSAKFRVASLEVKSGREKGICDTKIEREEKSEK